MFFSRTVLTIILVSASFLNPFSWAVELVEANMPKERTLVSFKNAAERENWRIVNDDVMGRISQSTIVFSESDTAVFKGTVSLENNGGFASTRTKPRLLKLGDYSGLLVRIKGDGKNYQIRVRSHNRFDGISYRYPFSTQPDTWTTLRVSFSDLEPVFRGRILKNEQPVTPNEIQQIGFLIAGKQAGQFRLEIDWIKAYK